MVTAGKGKRAVKVSLEVVKGQHIRIITEGEESLVGA